MTRKARSWLFGALILMTLGVAAWFWSSRREELTMLTLSRRIEHGEVSRIVVAGDDLDVSFRGKGRRGHARKEPSLSLSQALQANGLPPERLRSVETEVDSSGLGSRLLETIPLWLLAAAVLVSVGISLLRAGTSKDPMKVSLERQAKRMKVRGSDFGGFNAVEQHVAPVLQWLRGGSGLLGAGVPRGLLIAGPSGCGKTLLARIIAGESEAPLFEYSGSEFVELLVGMGSSRVRYAFRDARALGQRCVIFIDQIDLIAEERSDGPSPLGRESESHRTLGQLLAELDTEANGNVFVVAATSRPRVLDPALHASGRLSLRIDVTLPDRAVRREILEQRLPSDLRGADVDLDRVACATATFSGAELTELCNSALEFAGAHGTSDGSGTAARLVSMADLVRAKAKLLPQIRQQQPAQIVEYLDLRIVGQTQAKRRLAVAVSNHYLRLHLENNFVTLPVSLRKSNVLLLGPTGTGKTMLIESIAESLDVPCVVFNSTTLTEASYGGTSVEQMLFKLLVKADLNLRRAAYGIVCIDEFDKLAFRQGERGRHGSGGVQQELLKLVEGTVVDVPKSGRPGVHSGTDHYALDTRNILFVGLGAFNGLEESTGRRLGIVSAEGNTGLMKQAQPEDVIEYGFLPELVGRFSVLCTTDALSVDDLAAILRNPLNGLAAEYRELLRAQGGCEADFENSGLQRIAEEAVRRKVGARGLRTIMEDVLLDTMYQRPAPNSLVPTSSVLVDQAFVEKALLSTYPGAGVVPAREPAEILKRLDESVFGHQNAKQLLAALSARHYQRVGTVKSQPNGRSTPPPESGARPLQPARAVLLVDPNVGGRAELIRSLARAWDVPYTICHGAELEAAFTTRSTQGNHWLFEPIQQLLRQVDHDKTRALRGIVLIDDLDVLMSRVTVDGSHHTVEHQLLQLLENQPLHWQDRFGRQSDIELGDLFVVFGGAFRPPEDFNVLHTAPTYEPDSLPDYLRQYFHFSERLLMHLIAVSLDTEIRDEHWGESLRASDARIRAKYQDLAVAAHRDADYYAKLVALAKSERWVFGELDARLERHLLTVSHWQGVA